MNENVENLILTPLRETRFEMADTRRDIDLQFTRIERDLADLDQTLDGVSLVVTMLAGHVRHPDARAERIEEKIGQ